MDTEKVLEILRECEGKVGENGVPGSNCMLVDVWDFVPLDKSQVEEYSEVMIDLLREWPGKSRGTGKRAFPALGEHVRLAEAAQVFDGDLEKARQLFAFGKLLDWWDVHTPANTMGGRLPKTSDLAQQLVVGGGFISISGYRPQPVVPPSALL